MILIIEIPCILVFIRELKKHREKQIWQKLTKGELKLEIEYEYALYLILNKIQKSLSQEGPYNNEFSDLMYLAETHN